MFAQIAIIRGLTNGTCDNGVDDNEADCVGLVNPFGRIINGRILVLAVQTVMIQMW